MGIICVANLPGEGRARRSEKQRGGESLHDAGGSSTAALLRRLLSINSEWLCIILYTLENLADDIVLCVMVLSDDV